MDTKYAKKDSQSTLDAQRRVNQEKEKKMQQNVSVVQKKTDIEDEVNKQISSYLERKYEDLQKLTEYWDAKYEEDVEQMDGNLQAAKSKKSTDLQKLIDLKQRHKEVTEWLTKHKQEDERKNTIAANQQTRDAAATVIQERWKQFKLGRKAKEALKKLKKQSAAPKKKQ
jgi:hypothetical protein